MKKKLEELYESVTFRILGTGGRYIQGFGGGNLKESETWKTYE